MMLLSIVIPVYKEEKNIPEFLRRIQPILETVTSEYEIVFALDPSPDKSAEEILQARRANPRIKLLAFSRRIGQPNATLAGLEFSKGAAAVVLDVDLQDPPELIPEMVRLWKEGGFDVVYAQRESREGETWAKRVVSTVGYWVIGKIAEVDIPRNTGDFRLMSRRVVNEVVQLKESHGFLRGMVAWVGFRQTSIPFNRSTRFAGKGNYNRFFGSMRIGMNGIICFSNQLLSLTALAGFCLAGLALLGSIGYLAAKLYGVPFSSGNATIVILFLFFTGIQLISVGVLGEYIGRIYEEVKERPRYILEGAYGFEETERHYADGNDRGKVRHRSALDTACSPRDLRD